MKNIHVLPTDKPSRLFIDIEDNKLKITIPLGGEHMMNQNIYITSDEEIKEGDWCLLDNNIGLAANVEDGEYDFDNGEGLFYAGRCKKIILTTDPDLIKDGVQAIDDTFLEWFVKNPSCEEVKLENHVLELGYNHYKIIIPKEELKQETILEQIDQNNPVTRGSTALVYKKETLSGFEEGHKANLDWLEQNSNQTKQETLEEAAKRLHPEEWDWREREIFIKGAKWQQERSYSEEDMISFAHFYFREEFNSSIQTSKPTDEIFKEWLEQNKKK